MFYKKSISKTFAGTIISQLVNFAFLPLISRVYSPEVFSKWALFLAIVSTLGTIATFKYSDAIVLAESEDEERYLFLGSIFAVIFTALIGGLFSLFFFHSHLSIATGISVMTVGLQQLFQQYLIKKSKLGRFSFIGFLNSLMVPLLQFLGGKFFGARSEVLIYSAMFGYSFAAMVGLALVFKFDFFKNINQKEFFNVLIQNRKFPLYSTTYTFLSALRMKGIYFFAQGVSPNLNSYMVQSEKILNAPGNFMGSAVRPVFFHLLSSKKMKDIEQQLISLINAITNCAIPFITFSFVFSDFLVPFILGEKWKSTVFIFKMFHFPAFFLLLTNWLDRSFDAMSSQFELFRLEIIFILLSVMIYFMNIYFFNKSQIFFIASLAVCSTIYYLAWMWRLFVCAGFSNRLYLKMITQWFYRFTIWGLFFYMIKISQINHVVGIIFILISFFLYVLIDSEIKVSVKKILAK